MKYLYLLLFVFYSFSFVVGQTRDRKKIVFTANDTIIEPPVAAPFIDPFTLGTQGAEPIQGYLALKKFLEEKLMEEQDTSRRKYPFFTWNIRMKINAKGNVDTAYVFIKSNTKLHQKVIEFLKETQWRPAMREGIKVADTIELHIVLHLTKATFKKYNDS